MRITEKEDRKVSHCQTAQAQGQHTPETKPFPLAVWNHWRCFLRVWYDQMYISSQSTLSSRSLLHKEGHDDAESWALDSHPSDATYQPCHLDWKQSLQASVSLSIKWGANYVLSIPGRHEDQEDSIRGTGFGNYKLLYRYKGILLLSLRLSEGRYFFLGRERITSCLPRSSKIPSSVMVY